MAQRMTVGEMQERREERAAKADDFMFVVVAEGVRCLSFVSDKEYLITRDGCCCPDKQYRCRRNGQNLNCKHEIAMAAAAERGEVN